MRLHQLLCLAAWCSACAAPVSVTERAPATPAAAPAAPAAAPEAKRKRELLRPDEIYRILEASKIVYEIDGENRLGRLELAEILDGPAGTPEPLSSYLQLTRDGPGSDPRLAMSTPPPEVAELHDRAMIAFSRGNLEEARNLYAVAGAIRPDYFKTQTFLGNTYFLLGDLPRAEEALLKAIALNPLDYQAHLFLGNTYFRGAQPEKAKVHLTRAYMLNRNNEAIESQLSAFLETLGLKIRPHRMSPRVRVESTEPGRVYLRFDKTDGLSWFPLVNCLACWEYEEKCQLPNEAEQIPMRLMMYRECLLNQAMGTAVKLDRQEEVRGDERALFDAINEGYLEAIIFWEIVARRVPVVVLLLSESQQDLIVRYIEAYVFAPSQTA